MNPMPFIIGAYTIGLVVLGWCAIAPLLQRRSVVREIRQYHAALRQRSATHKEHPS